MTVAVRRTSRVRIFIDYWNFARNWNAFTGYMPDKNLKWDELPQAILDMLDEMRLLKRKPKELRAVKVYTSSAPPRDSVVAGIDEAGRIEQDRRLQEWFKNELDQFTAYTVDITQRADSPLRCEVCKTHNSHFVEQGVDTKIAIDLVALASSNLYDIAVLVTNDTDLVPSVQCVQDSLDKQVVHLGFRDFKTDVRTEAWGHLFIDDMLSDIMKTHV